MRTRLATVALTLVASGCAAAPGTPRLAAPSAAAVPEGVFALLTGNWTGEGTLFGRPARFTMSWAPGGNGTHRLDFSNGLVDATGTVTPVLDAVAVYTPGPDGGATARWTDSRPQEISIVAEVGDSVVVSDWTAPAESGRTEYRVAADGTVRVRDWVRGGDGLRPFGDAVYRRR